MGHLAPIRTDAAEVAVATCGVVEPLAVVGDQPGPSFIEG